jgi:transposase
MTDRELERRANPRLAVLRHVEEVSGIVAAACRYYGISRPCYYGWLRRYEANGLDGLKDRSSRPHHSPRVTSAEVIEKILWLRKHYHFDPAKIAMYLARYHDVTISTSRVWRILKRLGMNRLPASQRYQRRTPRWKRYEKQRPGHQLQVDVKFIEPLGQTGRRRSSTSSPRSMTAPGSGCCAPTPAATRRPPSPSSTMSWPSCRWPSSGCKPTTDPNSAPPSTGTCSTKASTTSRSTPAPPAQWQSGKIPPDRLRRVLPTPPRPGHRRRQPHLREAARGEDYYNYHRPHGALDGQTPYERLRQKAQDPLS